ncbi:hypothetical protein [Aliikangiella coralliicola]|uniref:Uncharacterized protein n=1 Tax=Aliikangiella coralliicola TaxID=2592383 RepID=A0A545UDM0_9GAMM|nr:hypothetical protein [Aliikangiella coralliicola]TQV87567.1 hypothetical protein FLL46_11895 [Aliikangiella coralliicola]
MFVFDCYSEEKNCLVLFLGQYDPRSRASLSSEIQEAYKQSLTPEVIIFLYPKYISSEISELLLDNSFIIDITRQKHSQVICVHFDKHGVLKIQKNLSNEGNSNALPDMKYLSRDITKYGYRHLLDLRKNEVLVRSPAGTIFVKPSGKEKEEFIYASALARNSCEHQFLAMSLLSFFPADREIEYIYIDTASISAIAESLTYYLSRFQNTNCKQVKYESFSSYDGMDTQCPDNTDSAWVIISASASMSMGKKIVKSWRLNPKQVITILSYQSTLADTEDNIGNALVFSVDDYSSRDDKSKSPVKVQVQGESFAAEISTPIPILFGLAHKPKLIDSAIYKYTKKGTFSLNRKSVRVHVDYSELRKNYLSKGKVSGKLFEWLNQVVKWSIPKNLKCIVIGNDESDIIFLKDVKHVLKNNGFELKNITEIHADSHSEMCEIGEGGVLILSSAISSGHNFVDVNRALRLAGHKGMRIFVTAFTTSHTVKEFNLFKQSLTQGFNGFRYAFFTYKKISLGDKSISSWESEKMWITGLINGAKDEEPGLHYWLSRKSMLEKVGTGLDGKVGLKFSNSTGKLQFAPDFVFWPPSYEVDKVCHEAVYMTVCAILQNARDNYVSGQKLGSNIYQHSVIAPENFVRFNDSLLQSCIWRAAYPSELDYRRSEVLSNDFQRILSKIMVSCNSERGEVCLDLLIAIALRWIKLSKKALNKLLIDAEEHLVEPHAKLLVEQIKFEFQL